MSEAEALEALREAARMVDSLNPPGRKRVGEPHYRRWWNLRYDDCLDRYQKIVAQRPEGER